VLLLLGTKIKAGPLISFVPVTVQASFLAGCGGSIFKKGVKFMVDSEQMTSSFSSGAQQVLPLSLRQRQHVRALTFHRRTSAQIFLNFGPVIGMCIFILWAEHKFHHHRFGRLTLPGARCLHAWQPAPRNSSSFWLTSRACGSRGHR
jgi:hypothetical protein